MMDTGRGKRTPIILAIGHASTDQCESITQKAAAWLRNAMQPGCGAAYPTMIREHIPSIKPTMSARGKLKALSRGDHSPRLLSCCNTYKKRTGIKEQMLDTGLSSTIRLQCMYWNCRAVPWNVLEEMMPSPFTLLSEIVIVLPPSETDSTTPT